MRAHFIVQVAIELLSSRRGAQALPNFVDPFCTHIHPRVPYAVNNTRATAPDIRRQYSVSCANCFSPAAVSA